MPFLAAQDEDGAGDPGPARGLSASPEPRYSLLAAGLGEDGVEHLDDEALLGSRQALDPLDLLLQLRSGSALGGLHVLFADEFLGNRPVNTPTQRPRMSGSYAHS